MLFHLSEEAGIERFEPRPSEYTEGPVVWAIEAKRLCNYLVPRDCPRVTYYAGPATTVADMERFLGSSPAVVAVESAWWDRLRACRLYCYHMPPDRFTCIDESAGYFVSRDPVIPAEVEVLDDLITELLRRDVELRFVPDLWTLRDAVVASTLEYSLIRMRNARPRRERIQEFGVTDSGAGYVLRPGGYAVIRNANGEVAAVSTPVGFVLPGGGQNNGESPEDAAIREVEEECGLRVRLGPRIGSADELVFAADEQIHYRKRCTFFFAEVLGQVGLGEPDHELVWLSPRAAQVRLLHESQRWAVAEACGRR
jgi:8-oxo-dGTP pyrophosphatase MutT (NUDIX family)